jgi:hypothetical protein
MVTTVVKNDTSFDLQFTAKNQAGTAVDLTSASTVYFKMALPRASACKINKACTVSDASNGVCTYTVASTDFNTSGLYEAELKITYSDGKIMRHKMDDFHVIDDLPST